MNHITFSGHMVYEPELRVSDKNNNPYVLYKIAVRRRFSKSKATDFLSCISWNGIAERVANYVHKGDFLTLHGELHSWHDEQDVERMTVHVDEVTFTRPLPKKDEDALAYYRDVCDKYQRLGMRLVKGEFGAEKAVYVGCNSDGNLVGEMAVETEPGTPESSLESEKAVPEVETGDMG